MTAMALLAIKAEHHTVSCSSLGTSKPWSGIKRPPTDLLVSSMSLGRSVRPAALDDHLPVSSKCCHAAPGTGTRRSTRTLGAGTTEWTNSCGQPTGNRVQHAMRCEQHPGVLCWLSACNTDTAGCQRHPSLHPPLPKQPRKQRKICAPMQAEESKGWPVLGHAPTMAFHHTETKLPMHLASLSQPATDPRLCSAARQVAGGVAIRACSFVVGTGPAACLLIPRHSSRVTPKPHGPEG